jgi:hypothetical protein
MTDAAFIRYLASKRTVDDRALHPRVWDAAVRGAPARPRVLEIGGGIGTMIERVLDEGRLQPSSWTMIDAQAALIEEARSRLARRSVTRLELKTQELASFLAGSRPGSFDLVIANAFLDLVDVPSVLPRLLPLAGPGGLFYFSITFDGLTALEPVVDAELDRRIIDTYHRTMDERITAGVHSGDSRCGRHLLSLLPRCGYSIVEAGASDWIVIPRGGDYPADEAYFLECILAFFEESLSVRPEIGKAELTRWLGLRREQLTRGELIFMAHQVDVLAAPA